MPQKYIWFYSILFSFLCSLTLAQQPSVQPSAIFTFVYDGPSTIYVDSSCTAPLEWGHPDNPTVIYDGPPGGVLVGFRISSISGGYQIGDSVSAGETVTVRYRAYDNMGNDAIFTFSIDFADTLAPVWDPASLPADLTIDCLDEITADFPLATDNCTDSAGLQYQVEWQDTLSECTGGTFVQTYLAEDEYGNQATYDQQITVLKDSTGPVFIILPQPDSAYCENLDREFGIWLTTQLNRIQATDESCDSVRYGVLASSVEGLDTACGDLMVDFFAEDQCGNRTLAQAAFTILDTIAPVLLADAQDVQASCDSAGNQQLLMNWINDHGGMRASDNCDLFWRTEPEDVSLSDVCNGSIDVTFIAEDRCGAAVQSQATFSLVDTTAPVIISPPSNLISTCGNTDYLQVAENWLTNLGNANTEDYCTPDSLLEIGYVLDGVLMDLPAVLDSFERSAQEGCSDSVLIGGSTFDQVLAAIKIQFRIADACGNAVETRSVWLALIDQKGPVIETSARDTTINCQSIDSIQQAIYTWYDDHGGLVVTDDCGTVIYGANKGRDEVWQELQDSMIQNCGNTGSVSVVFYGEDLCQNRSSNNTAVSFHIIDTISPAVQNFQNVVKDCRPGSRDSIVTWLDEAAFADITELCGSYSIDSFVWQSSQGTSGTGVPGQGPYPDISQIGCSYRLDANFYITDACGNATDFSAFYRLFDGEGPVFLNVQDSIVLSCTEESIIDSSQLMDNCVLNPSFTFSDDTIRTADSSACAFYEFEIIRTYTAMDACGNTSVKEQLIRFEDNEAPDFTLPQDLLVQCDQLDSIDLTGYPDMIVDNCGSPVTITFEDSSTGAGCSYIVERSWKATDVCGNEQVKVQQITVSDTLAPTVVEEASSLTLSCQAQVRPDSVFLVWMDTVKAVFDDNCSLEGSFLALPGSYSISDTSTWPGTLPVGIDYTQCENFLSDTIYQVELDIVAYDVCNNATISSASFTLLDELAPEINCDSVYHYSTDPGACTGTFNLPQIEVTDHCSADQFELSILLEGIDTFYTLRPDTLVLALEKGSYQATVEARDCASNLSICTFTIEVSDRQAPDIQCPSDTSYFIDGPACQREVALSLPIGADDNCPLPDTLEYMYFVRGATFLPAQSVRQYDTAPTVVLNGGFNSVYFVARDESGNADTCNYMVIVEDTIAPVARCQPATIFTNPSGVVFTLIDPMLIDGGSTDNCKVDSFWTRPQSVRCQQVGQQLDITLFVFDEFGNVDSCETIIRVASQVLQPSYELDICDPDTLRLFANAPPPNNVYTFRWTGPNGFTSNLRNPVLTNVGPQNSGTYELTITGFDNCMAEGSVNINISDIATPDLVADPPINCEGNDIRLSSNSFSGPVSYQWYEGLPPGGSLMATTVEPVLEITPTPGTHDYYVIVEANNCSSNASAPVRVEIISQPVAMVDTSFIEICEGEDIQLQAVDQGPGYEYVWTGPDGFYSTLAEPPVIRNATQLNQGQYQLVVRTGDCSSAPVYVDVLVRALPEPAQVMVDSIYCEGDPLTFTVESPLNSDVYYWESPAGEVYTSSGPVFNFGPASSSEAGIWTVSSERDGCSSGETEVLVQVEILPDLEIMTSGSFCEGDSLELSVNDYPGGRFQWSGPGLNTMGNRVRLIPQNGIYSVTLTSSNGCTTDAEESIRLIEPPTITALSNSGPKCIADGTDVRLVPTVFPADSGNYVYQWTGPNNYSSSDSIALIRNASQNDNGVYYLRVVKEGCPSEPDSTIVNVTRIPDQPEIEGTLEYCEGDTISIITNTPGPGDQSFRWLGPAIDTVTEMPELRLPSVNVSDSGYYQVRTVVNGCESPLSDSVLIKVKSNPAIPSIEGTSQLCRGDTIVLFPAALKDLTYEWLLPDGSVLTQDTLIIFNATASDQGLYRLRALDRGCFSGYSDVFNVQVSPIPQIPVIEDISGGFCLLDDDLSFEACIGSQSATSGAMYYWYNASGGQLLEGPTGALCVQIDSLETFEDGTNSIIVQAELNGCFSTTSIPENIQMSLPDEKEADGGNDRAICSDETARLNAVPPAQGSGSWRVVDGSATIANPSQASTEVFNLEVGENLFVWSLDYGFCEQYASDTVVVLFDEAPMAMADEYVIPFNARSTFEVQENDDIVGPVRTNIVAGPFHGTAQLSGNRITYFPQNGYIGRDTIIYRICSINCPDLCDSSDVVVQVGDESLCNIPTIFTPNNDGVNDFFTIQCLSSTEFNNNEVIIFNQYGDEVFYAQPYDNNWQGTYRGEPLPVGTYYYVVDFGNGRIEKGFLILER